MGFGPEIPMFDLLFFSPTFRISRKPTFDLLFTYFKLIFSGFGASNRTADSQCKFLNADNDCDTTPDDCKKHVKSFVNFLSENSADKADTFRVWRPAQRGSTWPARRFWRRPRSLTSRRPGQRPWIGLGLPATSTGERSTARVEDRQEGEGPRRQDDESRSGAAGSPKNNPKNLLRLFLGDNLQRLK